MKLLCIMMMINNHNPWEKLSSFEYVIYKVFAINNKVGLMTFMETS